MFILYKTIDIDKEANILDHSKHLEKMLEAPETRTASIAMKKKWHET